MLVDFYHLASSPLERVLPSICEEVLAEGQRLLVVAEANLLPELDRQLWSYATESFLPHGRSDKPAPDAQPVLLSDRVEPLNGATQIVLADGRWRDEALAFERVFYFFDTGQLDSARGSWRALRDKAGVEPRYWKRDERGKWVRGP
ncbi:MAG TPA: DNA polymerase III subunit chi [Allosphingosinicella sp.]|nr:DNA polymerase III subunit chi [Allosphingosinicella sp.]